MRLFLYCGFSWHFMCHIRVCVCGNYLPIDVQVPQCPRLGHLVFWKLDLHLKACVIYCFASINVYFFFFFYVDIAIISIL